MAGQRALAVTLLATVLWTTEALPLAATGLACVALLAVSGASGSPAGVFSGFAQPVPYFFYSVMLLGVSVLWLTDSWHYMNPVLPALLGVVLMVAPGIGVITWSEAELGVGVILHWGRGRRGRTNPSGPGATAL